jgi:hypothetical protein
MASRNIQPQPTRQLPEGEAGILVCLVAVPLIWTVLICAMISQCFHTFRILVAAALAAGVAADCARLAWLRRQMNHYANRPPASQKQGNALPGAPAD